MKRRRIAAALLLSGMIGLPTNVTAQLEAGAGVMFAPEPGPGDTRVGPMLAVVTSLGSLGVPLLLEAGIGRTDFTSLGQDYHNNHYALAILVQWQPVQGPTTLALRLGLGAYGEYQTVETDPPTGGGDNWAEMVTPSVTLTRPLTTNTRLVLTVADALLGPFYAVLDPEEYGIEHRVRVMVGVQF